MNEERIQNYLNLIQQLLNCPSGEELEILQANSELLDLGFLQVCEGVAGQLAEAGNENAADFLRNLASQLGEWLGMQEAGNGDISEDENIENYLKFIIELLQAEAESNSDVAVIYPMLEERQHLLNGRFAEILQQVAENLIAAHPEATELIVALIENLSIDISNFPLGSRRNNIEIAITGYQIVLSHGETGSKEWAQTQNNLGNAYSDRIKGEKADNLELAIASYSAAKEVLTRQAFPQNWATTQNNLGTAYLYRIKGEKADNLELAIASYSAALEVRTRQAFPQNWATTQNNLGTAYLYRIKGEKADNLELAIASYSAALEVRTRQAFPQDWAMTQNNLGTAYLYRIKGEKADNLELAIASYSAALEVRTRQAFPQNNAGTLFNLGVAYRDVPNLQLAYNSFADAINTVELIRGEIYSGDEAKQKLAEEWNNLYRNMVEVCLELKNYTVAIEYAERSKTRNLVELLATRDLYPKGNIPTEVRNELQRLRAEINLEKSRLAADSTLDNTRLNQLRQDYQALYPLEAIEFNQIQQLLDPQTAIIEWYITGDKFTTFVITSASPQIQVSESEARDLEDLINWGNEYLTDYTKNPTEWQEELDIRLQRLAKILHINEIIALIPTTINKLVLIPHLYLHLFPLHALPLSIGAKTSPLQDYFTDGVKYAPSCQLLQQAKKRIRPNFQHLFAVQNPTGDLDYTNIEVQIIQQYFTRQDVLPKGEAKKSAIDEERLSISHCTHFSCHGYFNFANPLLSALLLADSELPPPPPNPDPNRYLPLQNNRTLDLNQCLTLADIFELNLKDCRLVVLSACETGLTDFQSLSDEYIGLPSGFLVAGSPSVLCSLWRVNDISTAFLLIRFYENLNSGATVAIALNTAQTWLREAKKEDLQVWAFNLPLNATQRVQLMAFFRKIEDGAKPFASPYHWAAFCAIGE